MAKILAPNKGYTGISASVPFCNGKGETDKPELIRWFKDHGYTIEGEETHEAVKQEEVAELEEDGAMPDPEKKVPAKRGRK